MPVTIHNPNTPTPMQVLLAAGEEYSVASMLEWLAANAPKSDFLGSLHRQVQTKALTFNQMRALRSVREKWEASDARRAANTFEVDLSPVQTMFATAKANGLKKPAFHYGSLVISPAAKYPGTLYIKDGGDYAGKVEAGKFQPAFTVKATTKALLQAVALDPLGAAISHGKATGQCSCCGRQLTNAKSVELGIGPICRAKWGI